MTDMVVGFLFDQHGSYLAVKKNKPEFMKDCWNGIGGKIESTDLSPFHAMKREFLEETGIWTNVTEWNLYCSIRASNDLIYFFTSRIPHIYFAKYWDSVNDAGESLYLMEAFRDKIPFVSTKSWPNLNWLVPLAWDYFRAPFLPINVVLN